MNNSLGCQFGCLNATVVYRCLWTKTLMTKKTAFSSTLIWAIYSPYLTAHNSQTRALNFIAASNKKNKTRRKPHLLSFSVGVSESPTLFFSISPSSPPLRLYAIKTPRFDLTALHEIQHIALLISNSSPAFLLPMLLSWS